MKLTTVIFDMDGLLIDSEPLWKEAADNLFLHYGKQLTAAEYAITTGLRTKEFLDYWFTHFNLPVEEALEAEKKIVGDVINLIKQKGKPMPGVLPIINFFIEHNFKIGLATSSPINLINVVLDLLDIRHHLQAISSADELAYGKPHPEVYINCATKLAVLPDQCVCFEDSFNGLIAAKAAKMKCVIVPVLQESENLKWEAADLKIATLHNFNEVLLYNL